MAALSSKGTIGRADMGILTECARVKAALDEIHDEKNTKGNIKTIGVLTSQRRGLLRELGLTLQPSRSLVRGNPMHDESSDPYARWRETLA